MDFCGQRNSDLEIQLDYYNSGEKIRYVNGNIFELFYYLRKT